METSISTQNINATLDKISSAVMAVNREKQSIHIFFIGDLFVSVSLVEDINKTINLNAPCAQFKLNRLLYATYSLISVSSAMKEVANA